MLNQHSCAVRIVELFNDVIKCDPILAKSLFSQEWKVNDWSEKYTDMTVNPETHSVRLLGLLNGIIGRKPDGAPFIRAFYNKKGIVKLELNNGEPKST